VSSYLGLVAIELVLKHSTGLKNHNVPAALNKFAHMFATTHKVGCKVRLNAMATQLANDLAAVSVQGTDGSPRFAPIDSYPYLRYVRYDVDGWDIPFTTAAQADALLVTVTGIRSYLKTRFQKNL
jgi:hypothetical protein